MNCSRHNGRSRLGWKSWLSKRREEEAMAISDEIKEKEGRVRDFLRAKGLKALLLKRQANFSWLTAGGLNLVGITTEMGATTLLITEDSKYVISNNIEA